MKYVTLFVLLLTSAVSAQAELYKWVDKSGGVHYSDQAPPSDATKVERKKIGGNVIEGQDNFALTDAVRKFPVTLYANECGDPCKLARDLLTKRGIPFTQKNPEASAVDAAALKALVGGLEVPTMVLGQTSPQKGFEPAAWNAALDAAGYPSSNTKSASAEKAAAEKAAAEKAVADKAAKEKAKVDEAAKQAAGDKTKAESKE